MTQLEETKEYKLGRDGEILMYSFALEHGWTIFDIGGTANGRAPILNSKYRNSAAPDGLMLRNIAHLGEMKTKTVFHDWHGGSRDMAGHVAPPCLMQGIDRRALLAYQTANLSMPVLLWFLTITGGQLHIAALDELGEPFPSVNPRHDLVNWPISRMHRVATFDPGQLRRYFAKPRSHAGLPTADERKALLSALRPRQLELDGFTEHFITLYEGRIAQQRARSVSFGEALTP